MYRMVAIVVVTVLLLGLLMECYQCDDGIVLIMLFVPIAMLAPLASNLLFRSRLLSFVGGPTFIVVATLTSFVNDQEEIRFVLMAPPTVVLQTAPLWLSIWIVTGRFRRKMPDVNGQQLNQRYGC